MARLDVLDSAARLEFERPPHLHLQQQIYFFEVPDWMQNQFEGFETPLNQVGFLIQWGYFKASGRFFKIANFAKPDILFVADQLSIDLSAFDFNNYRRNTLGRHRQLIRQALGFSPFGGAYKVMVQKEALHLVERQVHPERVFWALCAFMRAHRIEVPTYHALCETISQGVRDSEQRLDHIIEQSITEDQIVNLNELFEKLPPDASGRSIHQLAKLKSAQELLQLGIIRHNLDLLKDLKRRYHIILPLLTRLNLSEEMIEYYAEYVLRAEIFQVKRRIRKYLILCCFISYQYFHVSDILLQTFLQSTNLACSQAEEKRDARVLADQQENLANVDAILISYLAQANFVRQIQKIAFSLDQTHDEKYTGWMQLMKADTLDGFLRLVPSVEKLHKQAVKQQKGAYLHQALSEQSRSLMNRVADIMRHLEFRAQHPDNQVMKALLFYQQKAGNISQISKITELPIDFLARDERHSVLQTVPDLALYRVLLARYVMEELKGARITVRTSHTHKAFEDYLIDEVTWQSQKQTLLERAGLRSLESWPTLRADLETRFKEQMAQTLEAINTGENLFVRKRKKGGLRFVTPNKQKKTVSIDFYPKDFYVSIYEVLHTVDRYTQFTKALKHRMEHNQQPVLPTTVNLAALIGWGCNLGLHHMAKTSSVPLSDLERATNWYFSSKNVLLANDRVTSLMNQLPVSASFREQESVYRSASDGQKYTLAPDSIHANYSAKYFGKDKGVTIYSFISETYPVFYTTMFSSGDYEAWYVMDGLLHNASTMPVEQIHSTDTHGVTDINFAVTHLQAMIFQPRIKDFHLATLYGMPGIPVEPQEGYAFKTGGIINTAIIAEQWDTIQRFMVTIKLNHALPSTLLRRLTSYSSYHPVYRALRELGRVVKTTFLFQYMHEEETRRRVNHQLTKIENMHQLAGELNLGKNGLIRYATKEDLLVMARSKQLLINAMTCWNMLHITQKLREASPEIRAEMLSCLPDTAPLSWKHINFQGEYDFSEKTLRNLVSLELDELLENEPNQS
jgi:TnpA family transposase